MQVKPMKRVLPAYCFSAPQHLLKFPRGDAGGLGGIFDEADRARRERRAHEDLEDFLFHECVHRELLRQKADAEVVLYHRKNLVRRHDFNIRLDGNAVLGKEMQIEVVSVRLAVQQDKRIVGKLLKRFGCAGEGGKAWTADENLPDRTKRNLL